MSLDAKRDVVLIVVFKSSAAVYRQQKVVGLPMLLSVALEAVDGRHG
jgi:hypothetical protein